MGMIDCGRCGEPAAEEAASCPHCGEPVPQRGAPLWYQLMIAAISIGVAYWFYKLLSIGQLSLLGTLAGIALYAGAVWMLTRTIFGKRRP